MFCPSKQRKHIYVWMILAVAAAKVLDIVPEKYEKAASVWYSFVSEKFTSTLMLDIWIAYTDFDQIISSFAPTYHVLTLVVIIGAVLGAGIVGRLVGFIPSKQRLPNVFVWQIWVVPAMWPC